MRSVHKRSPAFESQASASVGKRSPAFASLALGGARGRVSNVSTVTGMRPLRVAVIGCRRFWTQLSTDRDPRNGPRLWTVVSCWRVKSGNTHVDVTGILVNVVAFGPSCNVGVSKVPTVKGIRCLVIAILVSGRRLASCWRMTSQPPTTAFHESLARAPPNKSFFSS